MIVKNSANHKERAVSELYLKDAGSESQATTLDWCQV